MKGLSKQLGVFIAGCALFYALTASLSAVSPSVFVEDTGKSLSKISLTGSQKQLDKANKSQILTRRQEKINNQKSVQALVVVIQLECTTKADNSKTYNLIIDTSINEFFLDSNRYIMTMLISLILLRIHKKACLRIFLHQFSNKLGTPNL
ncbi:hypothetical protein G7B40_017180 [Aetokthonos hydrillicola Thurmond2011]|jgi:hypothetical protein|uniref:Uncharacterized protein n=1 Tax=Aetokthonos hydrillicola Thurmond2011 TaxID=2712845 RepID=A0AAP5IBZ6_9CYAN|nr:hypothetical protein [Aetokthonos hydrillicola]MBO3461183.1 hypothetical protein [Aetokthonos hydrillicola CCALA 1050]MBW4588605.1 hypothetical protein [Aetokthonos hydrillicola CCALA 1050]MDR9896280.1 hypothetical protein [Aetokthonos hydrillicola Thurmond2011]